MPTSPSPVISDSEPRPPDRPRRRLRDLSLTGLRQRFRAIVLASLAIAAGLSALGFALGRERARSGWSDEPDRLWGEWHSFAAETAFIPVLAPALVLAAALWARRGRLPRGVAAAIVGLVNNVALLACSIDAHLFDDVESDPAMVLAAVAQIVIFVSAAVLLVGEPVVYVGERRKLEAQDPVFPTARVVTR